MMILGRSRPTQFPGAFNGNDLEKLNFDYLITVEVKRIIRTRYLHLTVTAHSNCIVTC